MTKEISPFIEHEGQAYLIANWDAGFTRDQIILARPMTQAELKLWRQVKRDAYLEAFYRIVMKDEDRLKGG